MQILAGHSGEIRTLMEPFKRATAEPRRPWRMAGSAFFNACSFLRRFVFRPAEVQSTTPLRDDISAQLPLTFVANRADGVLLEFEPNLHQALFGPLCMPDVCFTTTPLTRTALKALT